MKACLCIQSTIHVGGHVDHFLVCSSGCLPIPPNWHTHTRAHAHAPTHKHSLTQTHWSHPQCYVSWDSPQVCTTWQTAVKTWPDWFRPDYLTDCLKPDDWTAVKIWPDYLTRLLDSCSGADYQPDCCLNLTRLFQSRLKYTLPGREINTSHRPKKNLNFWVAPRFLSALFKVNTS